MTPPARRALAFALAIVFVSGVAQPSFADGPVISALRVTPLKDGLRAAITWKTDIPSVGAVTATGTGRPSAAGPVGVREHVDAGTDHLLVLDLLTPGQTYNLELTAVGASGTSTAKTTFKAVNATRAYDEAAGAYRTNAMIRFDWDLTDAEMRAWVGHAREFAIRVSDMTDGKVQLGDVILADAAGKDVVWTQHCALTDCGSGADIAVFTGYGISRYADLPNGSSQRVTAMWAQTKLGGIESTGSGIEIPRYINWSSDVRDISETTWLYWTGKLLAHEWGHYGFWLEDQYDGPNTCHNSTYDISIMASNFATEIDSADTPCAWQEATGRNSWSHLLVPHYPLVGFRRGAPDPGPHVPGKWYTPIVLNRGIA